MRANDFFPGTERDELHVLLKSASKELTVYDDELARLRFLVHYVESQKQDLQREMTLLNSLNAPIRTLPVEILGKIFHYYVEAAGGNQFSSGPKAIVPAAVLAAVCKRWHSVALRSASLWSTIKVHFGSEHPTELTYLSTIIGRSVTAEGSRTPLVIRMVSEKDELFESKSQDIPMLKLLTDECDRWSNLTSDIDGGFAMSDPLQQVKDRLDQLCFLDIRQHVWESKGQRLPMFCQAPKLQVVRFDELHHMPRVDLPLSQVKTLSVGLWETANFETELPFCRDADELTVNLAEGFWAETLESRFVLRCRSFTLDASDHSAPRISEANFLGGIVCPNLEELTLLEYRNDTNSTRPFSLRELRPFLLASGQKLRSLRVDHFPLKEVDELVSAFSAMPLLEELNITEGCPRCCLNCVGGSILALDYHRERCPGRCILNDTLLLALTIPKSDGFAANAQAVLPKLVDLELSAARSDVADFGFSLLADMLRSRCFVDENQVSKVKDVRLHFPSMTTVSSDIDQFRWLPKAGVKLAIYDEVRRVM